MSKFSKGQVMAGSVALAPVFLAQNPERAGAVSGIVIPSRSVGMDNSVYVPTTKGFYQSGTWNVPNSATDPPLPIPPGIYLIYWSNSYAGNSIRLEMYSRSEGAWKTIDYIFAGGDNGAATIVASSNSRTRISVNGQSFPVHYIRMGVAT